MTHLDMNCPGHLAPLAVMEGGGQYKTIMGVKYEKDMLNLAVLATAGGKSISEAKAQEIWTAAMDGNKVTETEFRTLEFINAHYRCTADAHLFLESKLRGQ